MRKPTNISRDVDHFMHCSPSPEKDLGPLSYSQVLSRILEMSSNLFGTLDVRRNKSRLSACDIFIYFS